MRKNFIEDKLLSKHCVRTILHKSENEYDGKRASSSSSYQQLNQDFEGTLNAVTYGAIGYFLQKRDP